MQRTLILAIGILVVLGMFGSLACGDTQGGDLHEFHTEEEIRDLYDEGYLSAEKRDYYIEKRRMFERETSLDTTLSSEPEKVVEELLKKIESGNLKGAEQYMTKDAIDFQLPFYSKWVDYIARELGNYYCKGWRIADCKISGSTAKVYVEVHIVVPPVNKFDSGSDRWDTAVYIMEKEDGHWYFDRILGFW